MLSLLVRFDSFSDTNSVGPLHRENQDSILVDEQNLVFALADGVGGYAGAKEASQLAVDIVRKNARSLIDEESLGSCVLSIHANIQKKAREIARPGMGTTIALAKVIPRGSGGMIITANVGDSPILLFPFNQNNSGPVPLYVDDSERSSDPGNMWTIVQYLGYNEGAVSVHTRAGNLGQGDIVVLCSDGVTDNLLRPRDGGSEFAGLVRRTKSARELVLRAMKEGFKRDDMSAIIAFTLP